MDKVVFAALIQAAATAWSSEHPLMKDDRRGSYMYHVIEMGKVVEKCEEMVDKALPYLLDEALKR